MDRHHLVLKMGPGERVKRAERLIEQKHLRLHGERTGQTDTLLHATRNLGRAFVLGVAHMDQFKAEHGPIMPLRSGLRSAENLVDGKLHILIDGEPRQQRMILKDHGAIGTGLGDLAVLQEHHSFADLAQTGDDVE